MGDPSGLKFYALYFFTGLVPWNFFSATVSGSAGSLVNQVADSQGVLPGLSWSSPSSAPSGSPR
ncbi:MAG: hypothetical protein R2749_21875 [Acidimicrobiales bacterium]